MGLSNSDSQPAHEAELTDSTLPTRGDARGRFGPWRLVRKYRLDLFAALWVPYALLVYRFWYVTDDAFISFRYAQNLVRGLGLRFNPGEHVPVEGYSNFLWVMMCAVFEFLQLDITFWPLLVSVTCGTVLLWLVFDRLRRRLELNLLVVALATLSLGCFPPPAVWSTSGMATVPFALLVFITFDRMVLRRHSPDGLGGGIAGLLLALIRIEGIAWALVILILATVSRRLAWQRALRPLLVFALIVGVGYALYFAWRYSYYQMPLPNTAYAKAELDAARLTRGLNYVFSHELAFLTPILIVPGSLLALRRKRLAIGLPVAAIAWAFPAYAVVVTGDFMAMGRFLVPGLAFSTILLAWILNDLWGQGRLRWGASVGVGLLVIVIGLLPAWDRHLVPESVRERFRFRFNKPVFDSEYRRWWHQAQNTHDWSKRGKALRSYAAQRQLPDQQPSYTIGGIGATAYYSNLYIYDWYGLVTPEVARRRLDPDTELRSPGHDKKVSRNYFLKHNPTILVAIVLQDSRPQVIAAACRKQAHDLRRSPPGLSLEQRYVVDFARVPTADVGDPPCYIITWTRIGEDTNPTDAWSKFGRRLNRLLQGRHLPPPLQDPAGTVGVMSRGTGSVG
jgi:arabinofuranosyltransferase